MKELSVNQSMPDALLRSDSKEQPNTFNVQEHPSKETEDGDHSSEKSFAGAEVAYKDPLNQIKDNLDKLLKTVPLNSTNISFEFDDEGNSSFIRVIDKDSEEVIREIPSEEFRAVAKALEQFADKVSTSGLFFDKSV